MSKLEENYWKRLCDKEQELQRLKDREKEIMNKYFNQRKK